MLADRLGAGLGQQRAQDLHAPLHRVGGQQHLGHEQDAVAEVVADDAHAFDQPLGQHFIGLLTATERFVRLLFDLRGQSVVQVFLHQFVQIFQRQFGQNDFFAHELFLQLSDYRSVLITALEFSGINAQGAQSFRKALSALVFGLGTRG
jgi:hypothetical protein